MDFHIGQKLVASKIDEKNSYTGIISEVGEKYFKLDFSKLEGDVPNFKPEDLLELDFYDENGLYKIDVKVTKIEDFSVNKIIVVKNSELRKIQRREYPRLDIYKKVLIKLQNEKDYHKFELKDISVSGLSFFTSKNKFKNQNEVDIKLDLDNEEIKIKAKVIRLEIKEEEKNIIGLKFKKLKPKEKELINNWVLKKKEFKQNLIN